MVDPIGSARSALTGAIKQAEKAGLLKPADLATLTDGRVDMKDLAVARAVKLASPKLGEQLLRAVLNQMGEEQLRIDQDKGIGVVISTLKGDDPLATLVPNRANMALTKQRQDLLASLQPKMSELGKAMTASATLWGAVK